MSKILRKGSRGLPVSTLQKMLKKILDNGMTIDGHFGLYTERAVIQFQTLYNLDPDGIAGSKTMRKLEELYADMIIKSIKNIADKFVVFVDAGHGGIDDNGYYKTSGKRAYHEALELHDSGWYYEGYENRIVAEMFITELAKCGIEGIRIYHPFEDTALWKRTDLVKAYLKRGFYGYLHSFHSNAISEDNSVNKLLNTTGFSCYTTTKSTLSDKIAEEHYRNIKEQFPDWHIRTEDSDGDSDYEADFALLRNTDITDSNTFGAILEEFGFHTSQKDVRFIMNNREKRVKAAVKTALWTYAMML